METGSEKLDLGGENRQFTLITRLWIAATRESGDADDISSSQLFVLIGEGDIARGVLRLTQDLELDTFGTKIVEEQLGSCRALVFDTSRDLHDSILLRLALS